MAFTYGRHCILSLLRILPSYHRLYCLCCCGGGGLIERVLATLRRVAAHHNISNIRCEQSVQYTSAMAIIAFTPRVQTALHILVIEFIVSLFLSEEDLQHDNRLHLRQESSSSSRQLLGLSTANDDPANNGISSSDGDSSDDLAQADAMNVSTFWWRDIDYDTRWQCGRFKCYFPSSSNPDNGYLVQRQYTPQGRNVMKTYLYAKKLKAEHNITHFYSSLQASYSLGVGFESPIQVGAGSIPGQSRSGFMKQPPYTT